MTDERVSDILVPTRRTTPPRSTNNRTAAAIVRREAGRQISLTPEIHKRIVDAVKAGVYLTVAAQYAGVSPQLLYRWMHRGNTEEGRGKMAVLCRKLVADISLAQASAEVSAVLHWRSAMPKDWHAAERWLVATAPERWAKKAEDPRTSAPSTNIAIQLNQAVNGVSQAQQKPLSDLIHDNPALIGPTMQLLDTLLPMLGPGDEEGEYTVVEDEME